MRSLLSIIALAGCVVAPLMAQSTGAPSFDAASVLPSTRRAPGMFGGVLRGTRYTLRNATMVELISTAYGVPAEKVAGGPSWLEWHRYDIAALAPAGTPPATLREMLKSLLAGRFGLAVRDASTTRAGFALRAGGNRSSWKEAAAVRGCQGQIKPEPNGIMAMNMECRGMSMAALADQLPRMAGQYFPNNQPVVDETGIGGLWDFDLKWTPIGLLAAAGGAAMPMPVALQRIGLMLEPRDVAVAALVVDRVNEQPTADAADLATRLPALPPPEFDVASVRPSDADAPGFRLDFQPGGQVSIRGMSLGALLMLAWDVSDPALLDGPEWIQSKRFDIIGRAAAESVATLPMDVDTMRQMLRPLLVDRFAIRHHLEHRPITAYRLVADKPRMKPADPSTRARCTRGLAGTGDRGVSQLASLYTCTNVTMAQLGQLLPQYARDYTSLPVVDATGLQGGWDFTLSFTPAGAVQAVRSPGGGSGAIDPTAAITLPEAIARQLGLKLQEEKRQVPVLVIDSIAERPTEN